MSKNKWSFAEMDNDKVIPTIRIFKARPVRIGDKKISDKICVGRIDSRQDAEILVNSANRYDELLSFTENMVFELCKATVGHPMNCQCIGDRLIRDFKKHRKP